MTTGLRVEVQDEAIQSVLARLSQRTRNLRPAMKAAGDELVALTAQRFREQDDPWGKRWQALKPSTIRARRKGAGPGGAQILRDTGVLSNSFSARADATSVTVGTNVPYAAIHQFGGTVQHAARSLRVRLRTVKGRTRFAKDSHKRARTVWGTANAWSVTIPPRPMLPIRGARAELPPVYRERVLARLSAYLGEAS